MTEVARKTVADGASRRSLVDVAKDLHPLFAARAAANEAKGALTDETIKAVWDGGFFLACGFRRASAASKPGRWKRSGR